MCEHDIEWELTDSRPQQPVVRLSAAVIMLKQISSFHTIPLDLAPQIPFGIDTAAACATALILLLMLNYYPTARPLRLTLSDRNLLQQHFHLMLHIPFCHSIFLTSRTTITHWVSCTRFLGHFRWIFDVLNSESFYSLATLSSLHIAVTAHTVGGKGGERGIERIETWILSTH